MGINRVIKPQTDAELLSYIINVTPELRSDIELPTQGQSIAPIGQLIINNERYKNAFINTVNLIGLTVIDRNYWDNPWESFTSRGTLNFGQQVRELFVDIAKVFDYNQYAENPLHFLDTVVPDVYNYIHEVNFQKFYKTTTSDEQMAMAFNTENGLMMLVETIAMSLNEAFKYDRYLIDKYMLCRRILDGTVTSVEIDNYSTIDKRDRVAAIKDISNKMTFRNPNYNPAGVRIASAFDDQILIMNTDFEADYSTSVLATSYFLNEAQFKTNYALVDGFGNHDTARLVEILGDDFVPFTEDELSALSNIPCVIIDKEWYQDYTYTLDNASDSAVNGTRTTSFYNPETLKNTLWLHTWMVFSTSPFKQAVVFTKNVTPAVSTVTVSPSTATVTAGQNLQLSASVSTTGFANKAVTYTIKSDSESDPAKKAKVSVNGLVEIPAGHVVQSGGTQGVYVLTISTALATGESIEVAGETYTAEESDDTPAKQATAIYGLFGSDPNYTVTHSQGTVTFTEKSGKYGTGVPSLDDSDLTTGVVAMTTTTAGVPASTGTVVVTATSVFDKTKSADATITVA